MSSFFRFSAPIKFTLNEIENHYIAILKNQSLQLELVSKFFYWICIRHSLLHYKTIQKLPSCIRFCILKSRTKRKCFIKEIKSTKVWILKEVPSEKCNSVEYFHLHKKVPVVKNHNIQFFQMLWFITTGTFLWRWKCSTIQSCIFPMGLLSKSIL